MEVPNIEQTTTEVSKYTDMAITYGIEHGKTLLFLWE